MDGKQVSDLPWNNLSCQNLQPLLHVAESTLEQLMATLSQDPPVFSGGVCIKVVGDVGDDEVCLVQLYHTDAIIEEAALGVSYSVFCESNSNFCLALSVQDRKGAKFIYFLLDSTEEDIQALPSSYQFTHVSAVFEHIKRDNTATTAVNVGRDSEKSKSLQVVSADSGGRLWTVRDFILEWGEYTLIDVYAVCSAAKHLQPVIIKLLRENQTLFDGQRFVKQDRGRKQSNLEQTDGIERSEPRVEEVTSSKGINFNFSVQIGHISIVSASHEHSFTYYNQELVGHHPSWLLGAGGDKFLNINLCWKLPSSNNECGSWALERYHLFVETGHLEEDLPGSSLNYLGTAMVGAFYVYMFPVPNSSTTLTFHLRCQCMCGQVQSLVKGTSYTVQVPPPQSGNYVKTQSSPKDWLFRELH